MPLNSAGVPSIKHFMVKETCFFEFPAGSDMSPQCRASNRFESKFALEGNDDAPFGASGTF